MKALAAGLALALSGVAQSQATSGAPASRGASDVNRIYLEFQVEQPVRQQVGSVRPRYPQALKKERVEGEVQAQFVVDTLGLIDTSTVKILTASHPLFADAVRQVLPELQFVPAEIHGHKVKQRVAQRFLFPPPR